MPLFDAYVFVDWSARNRLSPAKASSDAIWVGELTPPDGHVERYCRGRAEATEHVRRQLSSHVEEGRRVLVGFDFPYAYPGGLARCLGLEGAPAWRAVWDRLGELVTDDEKNASNRFAAAHALNELIGGGPGPFWGCPPAAATASLSGTKTGVFAFPYATSAGSLERLRATERAIGGVQESWKLSGAGSVGSQALVGIPRVRELRDDPDVAHVSTVWPFETGFTSAPAPERGPYVLHAEIWPGIVPKGEVDDEILATGAIRDQAQVRLMCVWAHREDAVGALGPRFDPGSLAAPETREAAAAEEGWILGVG